MKLIDADALRERYQAILADNPSEWLTLRVHYALEAAENIIDAAPSIDCAADNPHGLVPSRCPICGEGLVPYPCMDLAQDSYRDGILYGQEHAEWRADG